MKAFWPETSPRCAHFVGGCASNCLSGLDTAHGLRELRTPEPSGWGCTCVEKTPSGLTPFFQLHLFWHLFGWLLASFDFVLAATPTHFADSWINKIYLTIWVFTLICLALVFSQLLQLLQFISFADCTVRRSVWSNFCDHWHWTGFTLVSIFTSPLTWICNLCVRYYWFCCSWSWHFPPYKITLLTGAQRRRRRRQRAAARAAWFFHRTGQVPIKPSQSPAHQTSACSPSQQRFKFYPDNQETHHHGFIRSLSMEMLTLPEESTKRLQHNVLSAKHIGWLVSNTVRNRSNKCTKPPHIEMHGHKINDSTGNSGGMGSSRSFMELADAYGPIAKQVTKSENSERIPESERPQRQGLGEEQKQRQIEKQRVCPGQSWDRRKGQRNECIAVCSTCNRHAILANLRWRHSKLYALCDHSFQSEHSGASGAKERVCCCASCGLPGGSQIHPKRTKGSLGGRWTKR